MTMDGRKGGLYLTLIISAMMLSVIFVLSDSDDSSGAGGSIGDTGLFWEVQGETLTISGTGILPDYSNTGSPQIEWVDYKDDITTVIVNDEVLRLGENSFSRLANLNIVRLGTGLTSIDEYAFNCGFKDDSGSFIDYTTDEAYADHRSEPYMLQAGIRSTGLRILPRAVMFLTSGVRMRAVPLPNTHSMCQ